jgi:hypothetical protein
MQMRQRQREDKRKKESRGTKLWEIDKKKVSKSRERKTGQGKERTDKG